MTEKKSSESRKKESSKGKDAHRNIGIDVKPPKERCRGDKHCPFHGDAKVRGRMFTGKVLRVKAPKMAQVEWTWKRMVPKYERYEKKRTRLIVHNPACINAKEGDNVKIMETRKISKSKSFVIIEKQD